MTKKLMIALLFVAASARADFDSLVRIVASTRGLHRVWTPGIGLVRFGVRVMHPEGVHDLQLAIFEGNGDIDVDRLMRSNGATPTVRVHERRSGETTVMWAHPVSDDLMEMLLVTHEPNDNTVVLRAVIDGEALAREVADPRHAARMAKR